MDVPIFLTSVAALSHILLKKQSANLVFFIPEIITLPLVDDPCGASAMGFSLSDFAERYRPKIVREWVERLNTEVGEQMELGLVDINHLVISCGELL